MRRRHVLRVMALAVPVLASSGVVAAAPEPARQRELVRLVRQDCGACHGLRLTGGLGPPLSPTALGARPREGLIATVLYGRPGTAMPPWARFVTEAEAAWITDQLRAGFPPLPAPAGDGEAP